MDKEQSIDEYIRKLNEIPKEITSKMDIKELVRQIVDRLKSDMRRRVSYGPRNF